MRTSTKPASVASAEDHGLSADVGILLADAFACEHFLDILPDGVHGGLSVVAVDEALYLFDQLGRETVLHHLRHVAEGLVKFLMHRDSRHHCGKGNGV